MKQFRLLRPAPSSGRSAPVSGAPIPEELRPFIFEAFTRGASDVVSPHGLELGLFIVKQIVAAHGGAVDFKSVPTMGRRSGFVFRARLHSGAG